MDVLEDEHVRTVPCLHSSPGWITQQKRQAFCVVVSTLTIRPKRKHIKLCAHQQLCSLNLALTLIWTPVKLLQSTHKDLSRVDIDLPKGLLVGLGYAATSPDSLLDFRQAQTAAERSGVANPHCWSLMLPTSARVAQEVYEPLIGIQYPMLCSRMGDTWQIGTTSIREDHKMASGLRFVHWCHASPNVQAKQNPKNDPTVRVYQHIEDQLTKAGSDTDDILALTNTREGATNLRNYFSIAGKKANAETAVKVAGATSISPHRVHRLGLHATSREFRNFHVGPCLTRNFLSHTVRCHRRWCLGR